MDTAPNWITYVIGVVENRPYHQSGGLLIIGIAVIAGVTYYFVAPKSIAAAHPRIAREPTRQNATPQASRLDD